MQGACNHPLKERDDYAKPWGTRRLSIGVRYGDFLMELIADYLCDQVRVFVKTHTQRLVLILKGIWDRIPKTLIRDLAVNILANLIFEVAKIIITRLIIR